jgi:hypothetical protein
MKYLFCILSAKRYLNDTLFQTIKIDSEAKKVCGATIVTSAESSDLQPHSDDSR